MVKFYEFILIFFNIFLFCYPVIFTTYAMFIITLGETIIINDLLIWFLAHLCITLILTLFNLYKRRKNGKK